MSALPLELGIKASLVIADTGIHGNTREAIQRLKLKGRKFCPISHEIGPVDPAGRRGSERKKISLALGRL